MPTNYQSARVRIDNAGTIAALDRLTVAFDRLFTCGQLTAHELQRLDAAICEKLDQRQARNTRHIPPDFKDFNGNQWPIDAIETYNEMTDGAANPRIDYATREQRLNLRHRHFVVSMGRAATSALNRLTV